MAAAEMSATAVWFLEPHKVAFEEEDVAPPGESEITVQAVGSLVSRGTELVAYRGELDPNVDLGLPTIAGSPSLPLKYGYQVVGRVVAAGADSGLVDGDLVFARHPHQSRFTIGAHDSLVRKLPEDVSVADSLFVHLAEVGLGCLHDAPVRYGDAVVVFGLGVIGTIITLLAQRAAGPGPVFGVDPSPGRREHASGMGVENAVHPDEVEELLFGRSDSRGADIVVEATGDPSVIQNAVAVCGREGTIAIVSFYGSRSAPVAFNDRFHFLRQKIVSSQVGRVGSGLEPRWDRTRRFETSARLCSLLDVSRMLTHEATLDAAADAYRLLDEQPDEVTALAFNYGDRPLTGGTRTIG